MTPYHGYHVNIASAPVNCWHNSGRLHPQAISKPAWQLNPCLYNMEGQTSGHLLSEQWPTWTTYPTVSFAEYRSDDIIGQVRERLTTAATTAALWLCMFESINEYCQLVCYSARVAHYLSYATALAIGGPGYTRHKHIINSKFGLSFINRLISNHSLISQPTVQRGKSMLT